MSTKKTIALALGGGGARGIAHLHVVEVLDELGLKPDIIAGSSIGSIVGAGIAAGLSGQEIRDHMEFVFSKPAEIVRRIWSTRPHGLDELWRSGLRISQFNVEKILNAFLPKSVPDQFSELKIPLLVTACDFYKSSEVIISEGDLNSALAASSAIPPLFKPVKREGRILIDGGIFNPVPFDLVDGKADIVIAVDVVGTPTGDYDHMPSTLEAVFGSNQLMMQAITANKLTHKQPDIFLRPDIHGVGVIDFMKFHKILKQSDHIREELKRSLDGLLAPL